MSGCRNLSLIHDNSNIFIDGITCMIVEDNDNIEPNYEPSRDCVMDGVFDML